MMLLSDFHYKKNLLSEVQVQDSGSKDQAVRTVFGDVLKWRLNVRSAPACFLLTDITVLIKTAK